MLVVGAGEAGRRRAAALAASGASVRWVAPDAPGPAEELRARPFVQADVEGCTLVFACATPEVNAEVAAAARGGLVLCGRADETLADFVVPARLERGPLTFSLSSSLRAPAALRRLRGRLDSMVPRAWATFVERMAQARAELPRGRARAQRMREMADGPLLERLEAGEE